MTKTLYQILSVSESASEIELHQAFKNLEQQLTGLSDNDSVNKLKAVREAFLNLSDPARRIAYDRKLAASRIEQNDSPPSPQHTVSAWPQKFAAVLITLIAAFALLLYWNIEDRKIQQAETIHSTGQDAFLYKVKETARQEELARQQQRLLAQQQTELENKRIEAEQSLRRQINDNDLAIAEQQLQNQAFQNQRALNLEEKRTGMDINRQELEMAGMRQDLQARKSALAMELKQQVEQNAMLTRQRALQQRDASIQSIRDLQAAKLRDYARNHYGSGGITTSNPAYDEP